MHVEVLKMRVSPVSDTILLAGALFHTKQSSRASLQMPCDHCGPMPPSILEICASCLIRAQLRLRMPLPYLVHQYRIHSRPVFHPISTLLYYIHYTSPLTQVVPSLFPTRYAHVHVRKSSQVKIPSILPFATRLLYIYDKPSKKTPKIQEIKKSKRKQEEKDKRGNRL